MKKYQYVLLDWDGNLARTLDIWLVSLKVALEKRGHFLSNAEIGADFSAFRTRMQERGIAEIDEMVAEADALATQKIPDVELYPDALEVLEFLHDSQVHLALVTTSAHAQIDPLLEKYNLRDLFEVVVCGDDVMNHKPHAEPLEKALKLLGGDKASAVMVGDSDKDIGAATNTDIDSVLFYPPAHNTFYDRELLCKMRPTYIIDDFRELKKIVKDF